jgi:two-component system, LytTR family, response regulator
MKDAEIFHSRVSGGEKLHLNSRDEHKSIDIERILYCEADGNYTKMYSEKDKDQICKSLCKLEEQLKRHNFLRIHNSYMVNLKNVKSFYHYKKKWLVTIADKELPVSRRRQNNIIPVLIDFGIKETKMIDRLINSFTGYTVK